MLAQGHLTLLLVCVIIVCAPLLSKEGADFLVTPSIVRSACHVW